MRINVVPVETLSDVHLKAEFREIIMSVHYYRRSVGSPKGLNRSKISKVYTLNTGHAMFFYNKFNFILERYHKLLKEMKIRGFKTQSIEDIFLPLFKEVIPSFEINNYEVSKEDLLLNLSRVIDKIYYMEFIKLKPNFYKLNKVNKSFIDWVIYYTEALNLPPYEIHGIIRKVENIYKDKHV